jgi:hypothetical protein
MPVPLRMRPQQHVTPASSPNWRNVREQQNNFTTGREQRPNPNRLARRASLNNSSDYKNHAEAFVSILPNDGGSGRGGGSGGGVRSWATNWLRSSSNHRPSPTDGHNNSAAANLDYFSPPPPLYHKRIPVLTLALVKLDEQLVTYCRYLADPSYENIALACALLEEGSSNVATAGAASSPNPNHNRNNSISEGSSKGGSPRSPLLSAVFSGAVFSGSPLGFLSSSPTGGKQGVGGSPSRLSPLAWLHKKSTEFSSSPTSGGGNNNSATTSASLLIGEWEKIVTPLFLLAGAEAVYADLGHAHDPAISRNLIGLYQRITKDLDLVRETLCDPFLAAATTTTTTATTSSGEEEDASTTDPTTDPKHSPRPSSSSNSLKKYYKKAKSLAISLHTLTTLTRARVQLIQFHAILWEQQQQQQQQDVSNQNHPPRRPDFAELVRTYPEWLPTLLPASDDNADAGQGARAAPVRTALEREVKAWRHLMETAYSVERCRYVFIIYYCYYMWEFDCFSMTTHAILY